MPRWRSVWLVARREILERGRSRGFVLSVAFTTLIVIGSILLPTVLFRDDGITPVGVVEPTPSGLAETLVATGTQFGTDIEVVAYQDMAAATAALEAEDVDAVVSVPADLSGPGTVTFAEDADDTLAALTSQAVVALRTQAFLLDAGVDMGGLAAAQAAPTIEEMDPPEEGEEGRFIVANIGAVLILIGIFSFGFTVLTGVVEEKQSRVVEVVLSTVRARDLLMGKVLGIGVLGLVQLLVFVLAGLAAVSFTGGFDLPIATPGSVMLLTIWFILGYALYATALGFLGANASTPVTTVAMISYFVAIFAVIQDPAGIVAVVATFIPPAAPFVVPLRAAFDAITPIEIVLSIAVTMAAIWGLFVVGARVYAGAVLQTAGRMKIRDAWRSAGE
jgi:ABC-2 type transport system permease protein